MSRRDSVLLAGFVFAVSWITIDSPRGLLLGWTKADNPPTSQAQSAESDEQKYSATPFDVTIGKLPAQFYGHNPEEVCERIKQRRETSAKGEFETTQEHQQRLREEAIKPLLGSLTLDSVYAFQVKPSSLVYDADKQEIEAKLSLTPFPQNTTMKLIPITTEPGTGRTYTATNALGALFEVTEYSSSSYGLSLSNFGEFPFENEAFAARVRVAPGEAKTAKDNLQVLVVCLLVEPYVWASTTFHEPTFSQPTELHFVANYLRIQLLQVWFYDLNTGVVFRKIGPKGGG